MEAKVMNSGNPRRNERNTRLFRVWLSWVSAAALFPGISGSVFAQAPPLPATVESARCWIAGDGHEGGGERLIPMDGAAGSAVEGFVQGALDVSALPPGTHRIPVRAVDGAGNAGEPYWLDVVVYEPMWEPNRQAEDEDGDGLPDAWERDFFGGIDSPAESDPDQDGLSNLEELRSGGRPDDALSPANRVMRAEVFIDEDPGVGEAHPMDAVDGLLDESLEVLELPDCLTRHLVPGHHTAGVRVQRESGEWSEVRHLDLVVFEDRIPPSPADFGIVEAEGFWEDWITPGAGDVLPLATATGDRDVRDLLPGASMGSAGQTPGWHRAFYRFKSGRSGYGGMLESHVQIQEPDPFVAEVPFFVDSLIGVQNQFGSGTQLTGVGFDLRSPWWHEQGNPLLPMLGWIGTGDVTAYGTGNFLDIELVTGGTLTWLWGAATFAVTFEGDREQGSGKGPLPRYGIVTSSVPEMVYQNPDARWVCVGWQAVGSGLASGTTNSVSYRLTGDTLIRWLWKTQYRVRIEARHGTVDGWEEWYDAGSQTALIPRADQGYEFEAWSGGISGDETPGKVIVTAPMVVGAKFRPTQSVVLTVVEIDGTRSTSRHVKGDMVDLQPAIEKVEHGDTRDVVRGWRAEGAIYDGGSGSRASLGLTRDTTFYWLPVRQYRLAPVIVPQGAGTVRIEGRQSTAEPDWYDAGPIRLIAKHAPGHRFVDWYLQKWSEGEVSAILSAELPLVARFAKVEPLGDFAPVDGGMPTSPNSAVGHFRSFIPSAKMKRTEVTTLEYCNYLNWAAGAGYIETPNHISVRGAHPLADYADGLKGEWFRGEDWTVEPEFRNIVNRLDLDFGAGSPGQISNGTPNCQFAETDFFSFRLRGQIHSSRTGKISLKEFCDDKVRIVFRGVVVLDNSDPNTHATVQVDAINGWNDIEFIFVELSSLAKFKIQWDPAGSTAWQDVPTGVLRHKRLADSWTSAISIHEADGFREDLELVDLDTVDCNIEWVSGVFRPKIGQDNHPLVDVTWHGAMAYCQWLAEATGQPVALPDEWLWEYAASGGNSTSSSKYYPWGPLFLGVNRNHANYAGTALGFLDTYDGVSPVGTFPAYQGLRDMAGNVFEWTTTRYEQGDPVDPFMVLRGGSWNQPSTLLANSYRLIYKNQYFSDKATGFRPAVVNQVDFNIAGFVEIPIGPGPESPNSAREDYQAPAERYQLSALEVTNADFARFLNRASALSAVMVQGEWVIGNSSATNGGKRLLLLENNRGIQIRGNAFVAIPGHESEPVTHVTWFGADAYCRHLTMIDPSVRHALPDQWQWENAMLMASGSLDRERVNYSLKELGIVKSGSFGADVRYGTGFWPGIDDAAGNVSEWTSSSPVIDMPDRAVIRGGAFNLESSFISFTKADQHAALEEARANLGFRTAITAMAPRVEGLFEKVVMPASGSVRKLAFAASSFRQNPTWIWQKVAGPSWAALSDLGGGRCQVIITPPAVLEEAVMEFAVSDGLMTSYFSIPASIVSGGGFQIEGLPPSLALRDGQNAVEIHVRAIPNGTAGASVTWSLSNGAGKVAVESTGPLTGKLTVLSGIAGTLDVMLTAHDGNRTGNAVCSITGGAPAVEFVDFPEQVSFDDNRTSTRVSLEVRGGSVGGESSWSVGSEASSWARILSQNGSFAMVEIDRDGFPGTGVVPVTYTDGISTLTRDITIAEASYAPKLLLPSPAMRFIAGMPDARVLVTAEDRNAADTLVWAVEPASDLVSIVPVNGRSAEVVINTARPFEATSFTIRVSDGVFSTSGVIQFSVENSSPVIVGPEGLQQFVLGGGPYQMKFAVIDPDRNQHPRIEVAGAASWYSWHDDGGAALSVIVPAQSSSEGSITITATDGLKTVSREVPVRVETVINAAPGIAGLPPQLHLARFSAQVRMPFILTDHDEDDALSVGLVFPVSGVQIRMDGPRSGHLMVDPIQSFESVPIVLEVADGKEKTLSTLQLTLGEASPDGHQIDLAEYFFDSEPVPGEGMPVPAVSNEPFSDSATFARLAPVIATLDTGWHRIGIRFRTVDGQWSSTRWLALHVYDDTPRDGIALIRPDGDQGYSRWPGFSPVAGTPNPVPDWGLGFEDLNPGEGATTDQNLVFEDNDGIESIESSITWAEYFIDSDPGLGNAVPLPMDRRGLESTLIPLQFDLDASQLSVGFHRIGLRLRTADGTWSETRSLGFHVFEDREPAVARKAEIVDSEYIWNGTGSPGFGNGLPLAASALNTEIGIVDSQPAQTAPLDTGDHRFHLRFKNQNDEWGETRRWGITVAAPDGSLNLANLHVESNIGIPFLNYDSWQLVGSTIFLHVPQIHWVNNLVYANFGYIGQGSVPSYGEDNSVSFTMNGASDLTWIWGRDCEVIARSEFAPVTGSGNWEWFADFNAGYGVFVPLELVSLSVPESVPVATGTRQACTGWSGTGSAPRSGKGNQVEFVALARSSEIDWIWRKEHALTVEVAGEGQVFGNDGWIAEGESESITAIPNPGQRFVRWEAAASGTDAAAVVLMDSPKTVRAVFTEHRVWSVDPVSQERKLLGVYEDGADVSFSTPRFIDCGVGSRFVVTGWDVAGGQVVSGTGLTASFTVNSDREIRWRGVRQHLVDKRSNAHGTVSIAGTRTATDGDWFDEGVISLTPVPDAGAVFVKWANDLAGAPYPIELRLNAPLHADAVFRTIGEVPVLVNVPRGVIRNSPNADIIGFTREIDAFAMATTETSVAEYLAELNAAYSEKSVRVADGKVYSRKELPRPFGGLELEWQAQDGSPLRRERLTGTGSHPFARPLDLAAATKAVLRGELYVSAQSLGGSLVLSGIGTIQVSLADQIFVGTMPLSIPLTQMGWQGLQIEFTPVSSSMAGISLSTSSQQNSNPFVTDCLRFAGSDGVEPLAFFFGRIGASANDQLDFERSVVNTGSYVMDSGASDFAFAECGGDFDLIATVARPSNGSAGLMIREGIRSDSEALSIAVGSDGKLRINEIIALGHVRSSYTLRVSRRNDSFAAEFFDLDGKWKDVKTGTLALSLHQVGSVISGDPCLAGTWVSNASGTFDGVSLIDLSENGGANNTVLLDLSWPGVGIGFDGISFAASTDGDLPVTCVTIHGARAYAEWKQDRIQDGDYGLPSEWEFEYAAGGYRGLPYLWAAGEAGKHANLAGPEALHQPESLAPVATMTDTNGLHNLAGNVWEWTSSDQTPGVSFWKTIRGGSFRSPLEVASSSFRLFYGRDSFVSNEVGFRIVRKKFPEAAPSREIIGGNLTLASTASGGVRDFSNPQSAFSVSSVEVSNEDFALYLNELDQAGAISMTTNRVWLAAESVPLMILTDDSGILSTSGGFLSAPGRSGQPVTAVTWYGANDFARLLSEKNPNWSYRLPTEEEWESAALAGYNAAALTDANYTAANSWSRPDRLFGSTLNPWGVNGLLAGVAEWTASEAIGLNDLMVVRGGAAHWHTGERSATERTQFLARDSVASDLGFRVVRVRKTPWRSATVNGMFSAQVDAGIINEGSAAVIVMSRKGDPVFPMEVAVSSNDPRIQLPSMITFAGGEAVKTVSFTISTDAIAQGWKDAAIQLSPDIGDDITLRFTVSDTSPSALSMELRGTNVVAGQAAVLRIYRNNLSSEPLGLTVTTAYGQKNTAIPANHEYVDVSVSVPSDVGASLSVHAWADWHEPASVTLNVDQGSGYAAWAGYHGLSGTDAGPTAAPNGDGIANLLKYAFNLAPFEQATVMSQESPMKGMPAVTKLPNALRVVFLRRKAEAANLVYRVMRSSSLDSGWSEASGQITVTAIDNTWELAVIDIPTPPGATEGFVRVAVSMP